MVMAMWISLRLVDTAVVGHHNEFTGDRSQTVPYDSYVQVPVNHDFGEKFERDKYDGKFLGKYELHYIC